MLATVTRAQSPSFDIMAIKKPGWLFVLPWSLEESGGVNEVVKNLTRCFLAGNRLVPFLLITSGTTIRSHGEMEDVRQFSLDIWSPIDDRHAVRALLSFVWRFPQRFRAIRRIVIEQNVRTINPHYPSLNALLFVALKKLGAFGGQIILSFHGSDVNALLKTGGIERRLWRLLLRNVDHIVAVSDSLGTDLIGLEPDIASKVTTIFNGVDLELFNQTLTRSRELTRPYFPKRPPTVISVGAFVPWKGHEVLLRAFSIVAKQIPDVRLVLVGRRGSELQRIFELIDAFLLKDRVSIYENATHEHVISLLSNADLFALASFREGFGLVVIEAAAARVPVVCTMAGGLRELITPGVTGSLVEVGNFADLAETIVSILRNPLDAKRMASNFYEHVSANLTWQCTYKKYLRFCPMLLDQQPEAAKMNCPLGKL